MSVQITRLVIVVVAVITYVSLGNAQITDKLSKPIQKVHNKIDKVETVSDIDKLLDSIDKKRFEVFIVKDPLEFAQSRCKEFADSLGARPRTKADFDNNDLTDLLIVGNNYGHAVIVLMAFKENRFEVKTLTRGPFQRCTIPVVSSAESQPVISYHSQGQSDSAKELIYEFGDFVERNVSPRTYDIAKLHIKTSGCYGTCPSFEMIIGSDRRATYKPIMFNQRKGGLYSTSIAEKDFAELIGLLNYIDFPTLNDDYSVGWTDDQTSVLTITFDGGKTKRIRDYGLIGTFGLSRAYNIFFDLRENQNWR